MTNWYDKINMISNMIEESPFETSEDDLKSQIGFDYDVIKKVFIDLTGITINSYISLRKLYHSALLISYGEKPFHVAMKCGYESYEGFRVAFKKQQGYTPKDVYLHPERVKHSPPYKIDLNVYGGEQYSYHILTINGFTLYTKEYFCRMEDSDTELPYIYNRIVHDEEIHSSFQTNYVLLTERNGILDIMPGRLQCDVIDGYVNEQKLSYKKYLVFDYVGPSNDASAVKKRIFTEWLKNENHYLPSSMIILRLNKHDTTNGEYHFSVILPVIERSDIE